MSHTTRSITAAVAAALALAVSSAPAQAADTTAPVIKTTVFNSTNVLGLNRLETSHDTGLGGDGHFYYLTSPGIGVTSNEAGTLTFTGRDWTGKALGRISGPIGAGRTINEADHTGNGGLGSRSIDSYLFPSTVIACSTKPFDTTVCGEAYRLKKNAIYSIEASVTDAAVNKSRTFKVYAQYAGVVAHFEI